MPTPFSLVSPLSRTHTPSLRTDSLRKDVGNTFSRHILDHEDTSPIEVFEDFIVVTDKPLGAILSAILTLILAKSKIRHKLALLSKEIGAQAPQASFLHSKSTLNANLEMPKKTI